MAAKKRGETEYDERLRANCSDTCVETVAIGFRVDNSGNSPLFLGWVFLGSQLRTSTFASYDGVWVFCFLQCREFKVGCSESCEGRKQLKVPPFGPSYLGKLRGRVTS